MCLREISANATSKAVRIFKKRLEYGEDAWPTSCCKRIAVSLSVVHGKAKSWCVQREALRIKTPQHTSQIREP